jgi:hypothetical protein
MKAQVIVVEIYVRWAIAQVMPVMVLTKENVVYGAN